jgi:hypothetical protein
VQFQLEPVTKEIAEKDHRLGCGEMYNTFDLMLVNKIKLSSKMIADGTEIFNILN